MIHLMIVQSKELGAGILSCDVQLDAYDVNRIW